MARNPETAAVAEAIRAAMKHQGLTGVELATRLEQVRGEALPYDRGVWVSKRTSGKVRLVTPIRIEYGPTPDLIEISQALGVPVEDLLRAANDLTQDQRDAFYRDVFDDANDQTEPPEEG